MQNGHGTEDYCEGCGKILNYQDHGKVDFVTYPDNDVNWSGPYHIACCPKHCVVWDYSEAAYLLTSLDQVKDPAEILHKGTNNECIAWILEQLGDE